MRWLIYYRATQKSLKTQLNGKSYAWFESYDHSEQNEPKPYFLRYLDHEISVTKPQDITLAPPQRQDDSLQLDRQVTDDSIGGSHCLVLVTVTNVFFHELSPEASDRNSVKMIKFDVFPVFHSLMLTIFHHIFPVQAPTSMAPSRRARRFFVITSLVLTPARTAFPSSFS